ncbi:PEPxxWA-CTERM sorting domain-containing protein [uncultured Phenylobacterium sp.]|uniref:PEPxxWA-CTERM sorting domain-containing protein n=1 Tax=uncultured Phenylobacterium sp. TaxID=349273 RepID=UPI0025F6DC9E|nr:PEPxxWA-CTERM sorting domain-containing protein [uncultured Phenylobacterium sp.]
MSRFQAVRATAFLKSALPAAAFACGLAAANPGQATAYFFQSASMDTSRTAHIYGPGGFHEYAYIAPVKFTAYEGTGATPQTGALSGPFDMIGFCLDIFHNISLGPLNLKYDDTYELTTNSEYLSNAAPFTGATLLTQPQIAQVGQLVNYGSLLYANGPSSADTLNRLAGLQGAIWQVINPGYTVVSGNVALDGYIATYTGANYASSLTGYGPVGTDITFLTETGKYGTLSAHQSFGFAAVPEPGTWGLLIVGFGLMGATLRRSRPRLAFARARA